jgi:hypothetical protein
MELYIATYVLLILSMCILLVSGDKWAKNTAGAGGGLAVVSGTMSGIVGIYGIAALIILTAVAIIYYKIERFKLILFILLNFRRTKIDSCP